MAAEAVHDTKMPAVLLFSCTFLCTNAAQLAGTLVGFFNASTLAQGDVALTAVALVAVYLVAMVSMFLFKDRKLCLLYTSSGACFDWLFGDFIDDPASVVVRQWPANDSDQQEIGGLRGFVGCAHTGDFMTQALDHCAEVVESNGGKIYYGTSGYLLTTDDAGAVTGAYGETSDGTYAVSYTHRLACPCADASATGG